MRVTIPEVFSLIEDPELSLALLAELRNIAESPHVSEIYIEHGKCKQLDLCASVVMDVLLMKAKGHWQQRKQKVLLHGQLPRELNYVHRLLVNSGVVANVVRPATIPAEVSKGTAPFRLVRGGKSGPLQSAPKEAISTQLAKYFGECLLKEGFQLREEAKGLLVAMVCEVLDNSELHGNSDGAWYVIGHFADEPASSVGGTCHIVLFNFGDSIYESLRRRDTSDNVQDKLRSLSRPHEQRLWSRTGLKESTLWTLYALQDGVSRLYGIKDEVGRGSGTVDMIRFFNQLSAGDHRMAIVSGDAYILVDGRYSPGEDTAGNTVIAFNAENDLTRAPDPRCVRALRAAFPGTLISLRFPINRQHLEGLSLASQAGGQELSLVTYGGRAEQND